MPNPPFTESDLQPTSQEKTGDIPTPETPKDPLSTLVSEAGKSDPNTALENIATFKEPQATPETSSQSPLAASELAFISAKNIDGLAVRYQDETTNANYMNRQISQFAQERGLGTQIAKTMQGLEFSDATLAIIRQESQRQIDVLFHSEHGTMNLEKHQLISQETQRYLDLLSKAQEEGNLPQNLDAQTVTTLVTENIHALAYQDRAATENLLGDHGVRHIIGHNIRVSELLFDQLANNGQQVKSIDRLMAHQAHIGHDLGYSTQIVREGINSGKFGIDKGHNVLSAKILRQQAEDTDSATSKVFSREQIAQIHIGILNHDSSEANLVIGNNSSEARSQNLDSIIHIADNTHTFEDKLPELLYGYPDSLKTLRILKTAGEIGNQEVFEEAKARLAEEIASNPDLSQDDRQALSQAVRTLEETSYKFSVGRICGNKPEFSIDPTGKLTISVEESAIHQETVQLFNMEAYDQLRKFIAALSGIKEGEVKLDEEEIPCGEKMAIKINKQKKGALTDYDQRVESISSEPKFQNYVLADSPLSANQKLLEKMVKSGQYPEGAKEKIEEIKAKRSELLNTYLS